jgi:hypothetical protein
VIDRGNQERFAPGLGIEQKVEREFRRVTAAEAVDLFARLDLRGVELVGRMSGRKRLAY